MRYMGYWYIHMGSIFLGDDFCQNLKIWTRLSIFWDLAFLRVPTALQGVFNDEGDKLSVLWKYRTLFYREGSLQDFGQRDENCGSTYLKLMQTIPKIVRIKVSTRSPEIDLTRPARSGRAPNLFSRMSYLGGSTPPHLAHLWLPLS